VWIRNQRCLSSTVGNKNDKKGVYLVFIYFILVTRPGFARVQLFEKTFVMNSSFDVVNESVSRIFSIADV